jgi:hypothetical protein
VSERFLARCEGNLTTEHREDDNFSPPPAPRSSSSQAESSPSLLQKTLFETNTIIYFLLGPSKQRQEMVHNFINELSLSPQDYEIHQAIPIHFVNLTFLQNLKTEKYLTYRFLQHHFMDPHNHNRTNSTSNQKISANKGKLALVMSVHAAFASFLSSNYSHLLLFEDDVMINPRYHHHHSPLSLTPAHRHVHSSKRTITPTTNKQSLMTQLSHFLHLSPSLWDIQYLGFCYECGNLTNYPPERQVAPGTPPHLNVYRGVVPLCTHANLLTRKFILSYLQHTHPLPSIDGDWLFLYVACVSNLKIIRPKFSFFSQNLSLNISFLGHSDQKKEFGGRSCARYEWQCHQIQNKTRLFWAK